MSSDCCSVNPQKIEFTCKYNIAASVNKLLAKILQNAFINNRGIILHLFSIRIILGKVLSLTLSILPLKMYIGNIHPLLNTMD